MRISDWSSDVCSSDLRNRPPGGATEPRHLSGLQHRIGPRPGRGRGGADRIPVGKFDLYAAEDQQLWHLLQGAAREHLDGVRSEEHTSELQSLMRISYAVFCLKKNKTVKTTSTQTIY